MADQRSREQLEEAEAAYADLVDLYPDSEAYLREYAKTLLETGKQATAVEVLRRLYGILEKRSPKEAVELAQKYPQIGRVHHTDADKTDGARELGELLCKQLGFMWIKLNQRRLKEGQHLYRRGEEGDTFALVLKGELTSYVMLDDNRNLILDLIPEMDVAGEYTFLNPGPHIADVVANHDSTIVEIPRKKLLTFFVEHPGTHKLLEEKADYRYTTTLISTHPLFRRLPLDMRQYLAESAIMVRHAATSLIHKAGSTMDTVDMLLAGKADYAIHNSEGKRIKIGDIPVGELIGDTSAVRSASCPADIVAATDVQLAQLPFSAFKNVVEAYPPMKEKLLKHAEQQRMRIMAMVSHLPK